jgi:type IV pilus assembly protein PilV
VIRRYNEKNQNGFTLLEVIIALSILSIGLLSLLGLQVAVVRGNTGSRNLTSAVMLTEAKNEELKENGFGNNTNGTETNIDETGQAGGIFTRSWTITSNYQGSANMEQTTVTTIWSDQVRSHSISIDTVLSDTVD